MRGPEEIAREKIDHLLLAAERKETERLRRFTYDELMERDKLNLDNFWLKDDSLEDIDSLPEPEVFAQEIIDNLEAALEHFRGVIEELVPAPE